MNTSTEIDYSTKRRCRYSVTTGSNGNRCELTLFGDYSADPSVGESHHEFWVPVGGGYVRETTHAPGTRGRQVCETLFGLGSTLYVSNPSRLIEEIRRLARRHCDAIDRAWKEITG